MTESNPPPKAGLLVRCLNKVADVGNKLPDPVTLFVLFCAFVAVLSAVFAGVTEQVTQRDGTIATRTVQSLFSSTGIGWAFSSAVKNFREFAPLGSVLTVMLGIGVAERTGLVTMGLRILVQRVPNGMITATLVFAGVMSSMVADAGYVVLTPLGAVLFAGIGRHPLAGLAAAFAGVSGGFSANLFITGLDPLLAGLTQEAARVVDPSYTVLPTSNYYFMVASTFLIVVIGTLVTTRIIEPMLGKWDRSFADDPPEEADAIGARENRAFWVAMLVGASTVAAMLLLALPDGAPLRNSEAASAIAALDPFFNAIDVLIAILFLIPSIVYGAMTGSIKSDRDVARMLSDTMATMGAYIVLAFAAAQFVAWFNWTNLGSITAVKGANLLQSIGLGGALLLLAFVILSMMINLIIGSASAKWAFMAPVFVPMLMYMGFSPEAVQVAYRVGDSVTNIISPLLPYLPIIIVFARKYDRRAGLGTLMSAMLPYSVAFGIAWIAMFLLWFSLGIPLGPGAPTTWAPVAP